ncbi:hypothetical protein Tco_1076529, partial [Tanacetum coccineum]
MPLRHMFTLQLYKINIYMKQNMIAYAWNLYYAEMEQADIETEKPKEREKMKNKMEAIHKEAEEKTGTFAMLFQGTFVNPFKKHSYSSCNGVPLGDIGNLLTTTLMERIPSRWPRLEWHAP